MQASLLNHLIELRRRLIIIFASLGLSMAVSYPLAPMLFHFLTRPLKQPLIYTGLTEAFLTYLKLAVFSGFVISLPVILWQAWAFITPGLHPRERNVFILVVALSPLLFLAGAALAYWGVCPLAWEFFLSFQTPDLHLEARMGEYLSLILTLLFAFGVCFQLPLILLGLYRLKIVNLGMLKTGRKYAFLMIVIVAAILTPPDIISPLALIIPLYALYELSIILMKRV